MDTYFTTSYAGEPFVLFGPPHLIALGLITALCVWVSFWKPDEVTKVRFRKAVAMVLVLDEIGFHLWNYAYGMWTFQTMIPLHVCSAMVWLGAYMLWTGDYFLYDFMYFMGIGGASQALLTPDAGIYGFPHYRFFQTMLSHGLLVMVPFFVTFVEGLRPTWRSWLRVVIGLNVYMAFVGLVNGLIGSNYMFIAHKPDTPSLIDMLGPWPIYLIWLEVIGIAVTLILYLPWSFYDWRRQSADSYQPSATS